MKRTLKLAALSAALLASAPLWLDNSHAAQKNRNARAAAQPPAAAKDAAALFRKNCATCHGEDGRAKTFKAKFNHARDLTDTAWQSEAGDERIANSITNGRGKKMPKFSRKLSQAEISSLVAHVRGLKK